MLEKYARIVTFEEFANIRKTTNLGTVVATSGGFDPIHPGHLTCIIESKQHGDTLAVIVNGDWFLKNKKGKPFMNLDTRCRIVSCIREVDFVIPFEIEGDTTVCEALDQLKPHIFTKGGDRTDYSNIPEWEICKKHHIKLIPKVGLDKSWSSSNFLEAWGDYFKYKDIKTQCLTSKKFKEPK